MNLPKILNEVIDLLNLKNIYPVDTYEEEQESDAGIDIDGAYSVQYHPYAEQKLSLHFWDGTTQATLAMCDTPEKLIIELEKDKENRGK